MSFYKSLFFTFLLTILFTSCQTEKKKPLPDISNISVDLKFRRFEKDFFAIDTNENNFLEQLSQLEEKYGDFAGIYFNRILASKDPRIAPQGHEAYVKGFLTHPSIRHLYDTCMVVYDNMDDIKEDFTQTFKYFKYYFPDLPTPDVTTFVSEYTTAAFIYGDYSLGVGLDFFLGKDYAYRKYNPESPSFSNYLTHYFAKDYLVSKTIRPLVEDLAGNPRGDRMLDIMIHNGKKLYILESLMPTKPDSIIFEVTQEQSAWLKENEGQIWNYFLSEDLLYSSDRRKIRKFIDYSPNSPGMPEEAPGRTANWLGWQIIRKYMRKFPKTSLQELINLPDAQLLLERSKYKPKRK